MTPVSIRGARIEPSGSASTMAVFGEAARM
jgi:hypothetical protein